MYNFNIDKRKKTIKDTLPAGFVIENCVFIGSYSEDGRGMYHNGSEILLITSYGRPARGRDTDCNYQLVIANKAWRFPSVVW